MITVKEGIQIGRWTILEKSPSNAKGEPMWLCRCQCGVERPVLERSLKYESSKSCGCLTRERAKESKRYNLENQIFGHLKVIRAVETKGSSGQMWECRCDCGNDCKALATHLVTGKKTHCGCLSTRGKHSKNIKGQKFNRLLALYPLDKRSKNGSIMWHCRCDCGNELDISSSELLYSNTRSCGCRKKEHDQELNGFLTHVNGTSIDMLKSKKIPSDNTTGVRGVYFLRGKYIAKIVFQKKAYYLGTYDNIEEAAQARKEAEELVFDSTAVFYNKWKQKAEEDPAWAELNPVEIHVKKDVTNGLSVTFSPDI